MIDHYEFQMFSGFSATLHLVTNQLVNAAALRIFMIRHLRLRKHVELQPNGALHLFICIAAPQTQTHRLSTVRLCNLL